LIHLTVQTLSQSIFVELLIVAVNNNWSLD